MRWNGATSIQYFNFLQCWWLFKKKMYIKFTRLAHSRWRIWTIFSNDYQKNQVQVWQKKVDLLAHLSEVRGLKTGWLALGFQSLIFTPVLFLNITETRELLSIQLNKNKYKDSLPLFFFNLSSYSKFLLLIVENFKNKKGMSQEMYCGNSY